jgi:ubiquinone/menaquinone biosynthesis C-methylase UbiE
VLARRETYKLGTAAHHLPSTDDYYMMGRSEAETRRLIAQSRLYGSFTRRLLQEAGIAKGMRVLDVGSGAGDLALMAAEMVGPEGRVLGVDQNPEVLKTARTRAQAAGATNATFLEGNIPDAVEEEEGFDAVVGRLVLRYQPDPVEVLGKLIRKVRPGGIVAFQDFDQTPRSRVAHPSMPHWERLFEWMTAVAQMAPVDEQMGYKLFDTYLKAGLPAPKIEVNSPVGGGPNWEGYEYAAESLRSMMPLVLKFGIATAEEVEIETLAERLRAESVVYQGVVKPPEMVSAWAIKS